MPHWHELTAYWQDRPYSPAQGDSVFIRGDVCDVLNVNDTLDSAGQNAAFVCKMRGFPQLPIPKDFADRAFVLVGDATLYNQKAVLPVDWEDQEGLDLAVSAPIDALRVDLRPIDLDRRTLEALRRQSNAVFAAAFVYHGVDDKRYGWMLRPSPTASIRACALGLAEVFMDNVLEEYPDQFDKLMEIGTTIHRNWPTARWTGGQYSYNRALQAAIQIVGCALVGGKQPGARERGPGRFINRALGIPDWGEVDIEEAFHGAIRG